MQTYSIAEVAKIFNTTKYTIRHYVDAQLLTPTKNAGNGYYAFTDADLYRLYQVITFRKIGYTIAEIKTVLSEGELINAFKFAEQKIQQQINELIKVKADIQEIVQAQADTQFNDIFFCEKPTRFLKKIPADFLHHGEVDLFAASQSDYFQIDHVNYMVHRDGQIDACFPSHADDYDYQLTAGTYACMDILAADDQQLEQQVARFKRDPLIQGRLQAGNGELHCYENILKSLAYSEETAFTVEVIL